LGIETSCDETGIAIYDGDEGLLSHKLFSQVEIHAEYGGVVPELASRDHIRRIVPLIRDVMAEAGCKQGELDGIAYTAGPGLLGALLVGASVARSIAYAWGIPAIGIHHMEGHLLAPMLEEEAPEAPFVALLVSGGHTQLMQVTAIGDYEMLGASLDDAAGEAFDKAAKMLGLGYPGGPAIAEEALKGNVGTFVFPRPMTDRPGLEFSFSGLKTFCMNTIHKHFPEGVHESQLRADIAAAFQEAVVDTLLIKCKRALKQTGSKRLVIAGGVSANLELRERMEAMVQGMGARVYYPRPEFCTDNGAMIAFAGHQRLAMGCQGNDDIGVRARWPMENIAG